MKIVIAGAAKSGTTALYYALKQSLPRNYSHKFEPKKYAPKRGEAGVLAKIIINSVDRIEDFDCFDKRIFLIRDPRDVVVSGVLYRIYNAREPIDQGELAHYLRGVEQKQRDPASLSLVELQRRLSPLLRLDIRAHHNREHRANDFGTLHPDYFVYKYEDLIAGRFDELERYLGFTITFSGEVDAKHQRVARTKEAGGWRDWFTPDDVEYYRPQFDDFLVKYGYDTDWALNPNPRIAPEHSTLYVRRMLEEGQAARRKANSGLRARFKAWRRSLGRSE
ncbi:MAG TPA: hypothetical protein VFQ89_05130 [Candidatus Binatia bacterium]|nr:hypothetical protein [Candidatus Binatia bacterium]